MSTGAAHVIGEPAVPFGVGVGSMDGVGAGALGVGVVLGGIEDSACGREELPHAVRINTTARTATLM
jgi:hypothetical protein